MEWPKLKTIILLMLVAVNGFLLVLVCLRQSETAELEATAKAEMQSILAERGIEISPELLEHTLKFQVITLEQTSDWGQAIAEAVLGQTKQENQGSRGTVYRSEAGEGVFQINGAFSISLYGAEGKAEPALEEQNQKELLSAMGMQGARVAAQSEEDGAQRYLIQQAVQGSPVFNCTAVFLYREGRLQSVEGKWAPGPVRVNGASGVSASVYTPLVRMLQYERQIEEGSTQILNVEAGYQSPDVLTDPVQLTPVWTITTDCRVYVIDPESGTVAQSQRSGF